MALLDADKRAYPGTHQHGTGTIIQVSAATAYAKPDQPSYGREVYIHGGLSDKSCIYKLDSKYRVGDRVEFTYVPASRPELGCKWCAVELRKYGEKLPPKKPKSKVEIDEELSTTKDDWDPKSQSIIRKVTATIEYIRNFTGKTFAYVNLPAPLNTRGFINEISISSRYKDENGKVDLVSLLPVNTSVTVDLEPQSDRNNCKYFVKNLVLTADLPSDFQQKSSKKLSFDNTVKAEKSFAAAAAKNDHRYSPDYFGDQGRQPRQPATKSECLSPAVMRLLDSATNGQLSIDQQQQQQKPIVAHAVTQTDPVIESILLEQIFADQEMFSLIRERHPKSMYNYFSSLVAANGGGK